MDSNLSIIVPIATALIVGVFALLVGALNQRHRTLEKRLDDLYSPIFHYSWLLDRGDFPKQGTDDYNNLLLSLIHI